MPGAQACEQVVAPGGFPGKGRETESWCACLGSEAASCLTSQMPFLCVCVCAHVCAPMCVSVRFLNIRIPRCWVSELPGQEKGSEAIPLPREDRVPGGRGPAGPTGQSRLRSAVRVGWAGDLEVTS